MTLIIRKSLVISRSKKSKPKGADRAVKEAKNNSKAAGGKTHFQNFKCLLLGEDSETDSECDQKVRFLSQL